jgi:hypothetical protein
MAQHFINPYFFSTINKNHQEKYIQSHRPTNDKYSFFVMFGTHDLYFVIADRSKKAD